MNLSPWWRDKRPPFRHSVSAAARTVVLHPLFRRSSNLLYVDPQAAEAAAHIRDFRPATIAGHFTTILNLAGSAQPTHSVVIFTAEGQPCLAEENRDALWKVYQLPVFEQVIAACGRLTAWECEAHDGLHLTDGAHVAPGCSVDTEVCHCGAAAPRAINAGIAPSFIKQRQTETPRFAAGLASSTRPLPT